MELLSSLVLLEFEGQVVDVLSSGLRSMFDTFQKSHSALTVDVNFRKNIETLSKELKETEPYDRAFSFVVQEAKRYSTLFPKMHEYIVYFVGTVSAATSSADSAFSAPSLEDFVAKLWTHVCELKMNSLIEMASDPSAPKWPLLVCVRKTLAGYLPAAQAVSALRAEMHEKSESPKQV